MLTVPLSKLHTVKLKLVTFGRNEFTGRCTCGWIMTGTRAEVYNAAATHDLNQWDVCSDDDMHKSIARNADDDIDAPDAEVYR